MALPLSTASFDVALAMHMLYNVPDMEVGVRELRRVLRPGGRALVSTRGRDHFHEFDLLFTDAVPGSSDREPLEGNSPLNGRFLLENGAAIKVNHLATLPFKIGTLLDHPDRLAQLKENARKLGRPRAAFDVVERSLKLLASR